MLTSPEKNVDIFQGQNAHETLTKIAGPLLMTSGGSNIQDIKTLVLP